MSLEWPAQQSNNESLSCVTRPSLYIDQIRAADDVLLAINRLSEAGLLNPNIPEHKAVLETDVYRLRRGLCLPSAVSTAINVVGGKRLVGDNDAELRIGDFFRLLLPHHGKFVSESLPKGWLVVNQTGDMYHHAVIAMAKGLGYASTSVNGFDSFEKFRPIIESGGSVAVSLNNKFVIEQTLKSSPDYLEVVGDEIRIKVQTPSGEEFRKFEDGRHVVTVVAMDRQEVLISDSFNLPQSKPELIRIGLEEADRYLKYHDGATTRAVVIGKSDLNVTSLNLTNVQIPAGVQESLMAELCQYGQY